MNSVSHETAVSNKPMTICDLAVELDNRLNNIGDQTAKIRTILYGDPDCGALEQSKDIEPGCLGGHLRILLDRARCVEDMLSGILENLH